MRKILLFQRLKFQRWSVVLNRWKFRLIIIKLEWYLCGWGVLKTTFYNRFWMTLAWKGSKILSKFDAGKFLEDLIVTFELFCLYFIKVIWFSVKTFIVKFRQNLTFICQVCQFLRKLHLLPHLVKFAACTRDWQNFAKKL